MERALEERLRRLQVDFEESFAKESEETEPGGLNPHLTVRVGVELFAVPIQNVQRLVRDVHVVPLPGTPPHLLGVMNLRGDLVTVYDLPMVFGYGPAGNAGTGVVVTKGLPFDAGLAVDEIGRLVDLGGSQVEPAPGMLPDPLWAMVRGMVRHDDGLFLLPDLEALFVRLDARRNTRHLMECS